VYINTCPYLDSNPYTCRQTRSLLTTIKYAAYVQAYYDITIVSTIGYVGRN